jgi:peptide-methionine (S)-S-oxide reductase
MSQSETIVLGGGCFWCVEAVFDDLKGVSAVESGYMGGRTANPTYEDICTGETGHAEVIRVSFDPAVVSLTDILLVFFTVHDPTTLNRQGNDVGTQYRSVIFYANEAQAAAAREVMEVVRKEGIYDDPLVTEVSPASSFYIAENYHQEYFRPQPDAALLHVCGGTESEKVSQAVRFAIEIVFLRRVAPYNAAIARASCSTESGAEPSALLLMMIVTRCPARAVAAATRASVARVAMSSSTNRLKGAYPALASS